MKIRKDEFLLLLVTYILCIALFGNLALLSNPADKRALIIGGIVCFVIMCSHFIIRKFYPEGDKFLLIFSCILSAIGIAMLYRIDYTYAVKQIVWFVLGILIFILTVVFLPRMKKLSTCRYLYLALTIIFMLLAPLFAPETNGANNWIYIAGIGIQPSEFGKITLVLYLSSALKGYSGKEKTIKQLKNLIEPALVTIFSLGCLVYQTDLGSALIFFGISISLLYVATSKKKYVVLCLGLSAVGGSMAYKLFGHIRDRVQIWLDPWSDPTDAGYQIIQGLYAIASGGMFGLGLGRGYPDFVPVRESDYIFAMICEEFGMIFGIGILILFFLLFYRGIRVAFVTNNRFSQLVAVGLSVMIACQALVIIGGIFKIIPLTGITLPFISAGGSSMLTMFFALGLLQKVSEEG